MRYSPPDFGYDLQRIADEHAEVWPDRFCYDSGADVHLVELTTRVFVRRQASRTNIWLGAGRAQTPSQGTHSQSVAPTRRGFIRSFLVFETKKA